MNILLLKTDSLYLNLIDFRSQRYGPSQRINDRMKNNISGNDEFKINV